METATTGTANHSAGTDNRCRGAACDPLLAGIHDTGHRRSDRARAAAVTNRLWRQRVDHTVGVRHQLAHVASIRIPVTIAIAIAVAIAIAIAVTIAIAIAIAVAVAVAVAVPSPLPPPSVLFR